MTSCVLFDFDFPLSLLFYYIIGGLLRKLEVSFGWMADDLFGHRLEVGGVGGISQPGRVEQTEPEPLVDPVAGSVHTPAGVVAEWRRLGRPRHQVLNIAPCQLATVTHIRRHSSLQGIPPPATGIGTVPLPTISACTFPHCAVTGFRKFTFHIISTIYEQLVRYYFNCQNPVEMWQQVFEADLSWSSRAIIPAASGADADVPEWALVHVLCKSVVVWTTTPQNELDKYQEIGKHGNIFSTLCLLK